MRKQFVFHSLNFYLSTENRREKFVYERSDNSQICDNNCQSPVDNSQT